MATLSQGLTGPCRLLNLAMVRHSQRRDRERGHLRAKLGPSSGFCFETRHGRGEGMQLM